MAAKPIEGMTFASAAEFEAFMKKLGYHLVLYKRGGAFVEYVVNAGLEYLGSAKWLKKSGKATYDFMYNDVRQDRPLQILKS